MLIPISQIWERMKRLKMKPYELQRRENDVEVVRERMAQISASLEQRRRCRREQPRVRVHKPVGAMKCRRNHNINADVNHFDALEESIATFGQYIMSDLYARQLEGVYGIGELLSRPVNPPIANVVQAGIVPIFVQFLVRHDAPEIQFQVTTALNKIVCAMPEQINGLIELDAVRALVAVIASPSGSPNLKEHGAMLIGNISLESLEARDRIIAEGAITPMLNLIPLPLPGHVGIIQLEPSAYSTISWVLFNLLRQPSPPPEMIIPLLPTLRNLLRIGDRRITSDVCWTLAFVSNNSPQIIEAIIAHKDFVNLVLRVIDEEFYSPNVIEPALRLLGCIATGSNDRMQILIDHGLLPCLNTLLTRRIPDFYAGDHPPDFYAGDHQPDRSCFHIACWTIAVITNEGTSAQLQAVVDAGLINLLFQFTGAEDSIKEEAAWAITHAVIRATNNQLDILINEGCVEALISFLYIENENLQLRCIEALAVLLQVNNDESREAMIRRGGWAKVRSLRTNASSPAISQSADDLVQNYCDGQLDTIYQNYMAGGFVFSSKASL